MRALVILCEHDAILVPFLERSIYLSPRKPSVFSVTVSLTYISSHTNFRVQAPGFPPSHCCALKSLWLFRSRAFALWKPIIKISLTCEHDAIFWLSVSAVLIADVENTRFELVTSCLQGRRSPNWANPPWNIYSCNVNKIPYFKGECQYFLHIFFKIFFYIQPYAAARHHMKLMILMWPQGNALSVF